MLALCAAAGGVLVRNRLRTGTTIVLLPWLPAEAPREVFGE